MGILEFIQEFNSKYANAFQALTPVVLGVFSFFYFKLYYESKLNEGDAALMVSNVFWTFGRKFKILAVHRYEASDDGSGYTHLSQNSRPDQWQALIHVQSNIFGLRHKLVPSDPADILTVIISRNGKEKWKTINFNK